VNVQSVIFPYDTIQQQEINGLTTHSNINQSQEHHAKWKKPETQS
jgi:hypothetical protein